MKGDSSKSMFNSSHAGSGSFASFTKTKPSVWWRINFSYCLAKYEEEALKRIGRFSTRTNNDFPLGSHLGARADAREADETRRENTFVVGEVTRLTKRDQTKRETMTTIAPSERKVETWRWEGRSVVFWRATTRATMAVDWERVKSATASLLLQRRSRKIKRRQVFVIAWRRCRNNTDSTSIVFHTPTPQKLSSFSSSYFCRTWSWLTEHVFWHKITLLTLHCFQVFLLNSTPAAENNLYPFTKNIHMGLVFAKRAKMKIFSASGLARFWTSGFWT